MRYGEIIRKQREKYMNTIKKIIKCFLDSIAVNLSVAAALILKYDFDIEVLRSMIPTFLPGIPILTVSFLLVMWALNGYRVLWQFAGTRDRNEFACTVLIANIPYTIAHALLTKGYPLSVYIISAVFMVCALMELRMCYKIYYKLKYRKAGGGNLFAKSHVNVMIVGAGSAGNMMLHDIKNNPQFNDYRAVCFIDDDKKKSGSYLCRVKIAGGTETIAENVRKYKVSVIVFAIPSCDKEERARILNICSETGCEVKTLPSIDQIVNEKVGISELRNVQVEDLLGRAPVRLDLESVKSFIAGKTVMVTGGGGSIGSELCRQIASYGVGRLIIYDIYENNAYDIQNELRHTYPSLDLVTLIGSVRDSARLEMVLDKYRPEVIYHAAAHKHVPLMEDSPNEAVKNNVFGTLNVVRAADKYGVGRFIMISTDKAVNPTNVMGATKRICEMIIQTYARRSKTEFVAVRFGNVLGSNGSVIPLFKKQIEEGGPVTVTHPDIIRYFMTIPEAVSLVLEAGVDAKGGEIFVLDMGQPVKILTLAENLIRLSGLTPYKDINIKFTGLRPGEKLYEEMLMKEEGLTETDNKLIYIGKPIELDGDALLESLERLRGLIYNDNFDIRAAIHELVPTYKVPESSK